MIKKKVKLTKNFFGFWPIKLIKKINITKKKKSLIFKKDLAFSNPLINSKLIFSNSISNNKNLNFYISSKINKYRNKINILDIKVLLYNFRSLLPFLSTFFYKRRKILIIGNTLDLSSLLHKGFIKKCRKEIIVYKQSWEDGYLTNYRKHKIIKVKIDSKNIKGRKKVKLILKQKTNKIGLIILLKEIKNREIEILKSQFIRNKLIIHLTNLNCSEKIISLASHNFIMNTSSINSFFFFLNFIKKNFNLIKN